jgi:aryl-alcohol dehydrogenase-like predicted oxidoreductase
MQYHLLGRTGLQVSEIGFGGAPAGLRNYLGKWDPDQEDAERSIVEAVHKAVELGINYFDTAPGYGDGASERMFGKAIHAYRGSVSIATKAGATTKDGILRSAEASLERLQVDSIDVLQIHGTWYTDEQIREILGPGGALEGLLSLRSQGLVKYIGFTTEGANGPASQLIASGEFDVVQCCYNLIYQHPYDPDRKAGLMFEAEARGMGIVTMRPLTSGIFQKWFEHVFAEEPQAASFQPRLNPALLSFVLSNPMIDSVLVGMRSAAEVSANAAVCEDPRFRLDLERLHQRYVQ